jgi:biopolymer transport protein TolR
MGMSVGGNNSGLTSDPNVVPMIDIMLVLLIVFMIMQPRVRKAIDLQLPDPNPTIQPANSKSDQIVMEVLPDFRFLINKEEVTRDRLPERLRQIYDPRPQKIMFIKGDTNVLYADVIWAMDVARGSGVKVIGVPPPDKAR